MATKTIHTMYAHDSFERSQPTQPSPTLTNPDMVLPDDIYANFPLLPSPPRNQRWERPPSPSYLRDNSNEQQHTRTISGSSGSSRTISGKETFGLMSRKMMFLRSRSYSNSQQLANVQPAEIGLAVDPASADPLPSMEPGLQPTASLAPEAASAPDERKSTRGDSFGSEDFAGMPEFLEKYRGEDLNTDDGYESENPARQRCGFALTSDNIVDEKRRQQQEDEQNSLILSKRAEQILANAKKRLNLMEGNLRGARDLVAPLTAANLKRATSLGSSYQGTSGFGGGRHVGDGYRYMLSGHQPSRKLHTQVSSPAMNHQYHVGHWRGFSETEIPGRPATALESPIRAINRIPVKASDPSWTQALRGSKSYDSLGGIGMRLPPTRDPLHARGSPDPALEPVVEDDTATRCETVTHEQDSFSYEDMAASSRSSSRTEDLREQMSNLKGKISTLKERAREDSLRRRSMLSLQEPSPLNNASSSAPEFYYTSSQAYGTPALDTNAGIGQLSPTNSPPSPDVAQRSFPGQAMWTPDQVRTVSRNAFAEQAAKQKEHQHYRNASDESGRVTPQNRLWQPFSQEQDFNHASMHERTPSGSAVVGTAKQRYSHHEYNMSTGKSKSHYRNKSEESRDDETSRPVEEASDDWSSQQRSPVSEKSVSVYEDATEKQTSVVAHEDRADAFDYEKFFLHSAMKVYDANYSGVADKSLSSSESVSSVSTARGPTTNLHDLDDEFEEDDDGYDYEDSFPLDPPGTPDQLRRIEQDLNRKRTMSNESISTLGTFATADEGEDLPNASSRRASPMPWPILSPTNQSPSTSPTNYSRPTSRTRSRPGSRSTSRQTARPQTATRIKQPTALSDSSSERADSGVGLPNQQERRRQHNTGITTAQARSAGAASRSPPMSPSAMVFQDPATVIVNALLKPNGRQLGLRDKALLFDVVQHLRKTVQALQCDDEQYRNPLPRQSLEEVRKILDGGDVERPGTR